MRLSHIPRLIVAALLAALLSALPGAAEPIAKIRVSEAGIFAVSADQIEAAGIALGDLPADEAAITCLGARQAMVMQDVNENGRFDGSDRIVFYGQLLRDEGFYRNRYNDENIYLLERLAPDENPLRLERPALLGPDRTMDVEAPPRLHRLVHLEEDHYFPGPYQTSGVQHTDFTFYTFLNKLYEHALVRTFPFDLPGPDRRASEGFDMTILLFGQSRASRSRTEEITDHSVTVALNGEELGVVNFDGAAEHRALLENVPTSLLRSTGNELTITLNERPEVHAESLMFDWVEIQYPTPSFLASDMAELAIPGAVTGQTFELQGIASDRVHLFCLSNNSVVPVETQIDVTGGLTASFTAPCDNGLYAIATSDRFLSPSGVEPFAPELPLVPDHPVDHLIITHGDFRSAADRLAQHRREHGGLSSMVVDVQDIYDRFNHGIISSEALRDGLRHVWQTWPEPKPRYVLLIGDASWDWHQLESSVPNFIPTHFYPTNGPDYASDSHFAMVDDEQIPRFAVGRLPTKTLEEADGVVDKLIAYDLEMERERVAGEVGDWRRRIIFAASDNPRYRNFLNKAVETHIEGRFELTRAYADDESPLDCTQALVDAFNGGVSFVSYVGHGARGVWQTATSMARTTADYEANFRPSRVDDLHNATQLPIVFGITCFTNNFDNPSPVNCIGERLVLSPSGGAIACIGTSSYSYISSDLIMCDALFEALFEDGVTRVGDMYLNAIGRDRVSAEIRKMFIVLGDPASAIPIQAPDGTLVSASEGTNVSSAPEASPEVAAN